MDNKKQRSKKLFFMVGLIICPLILLIPILSGFSGRTLSLFPGMISWPEVQSATYTRETTIKEISLQKDKITFRFISSPGEGYHGAFLKFPLQKYLKHINLKDYKYFSLRIPEFKTGQCILYIMTDVPGVSSWKPFKPTTFRSNELILELLPEKKSYKAPIKEFNTQNWWYLQNNIKKETIGEETFSQVVSFEIHFIHRPEAPLPGEEEFFVLEELLLIKSIPPLSIVLLAALGVYYPGLLAMFYGVNKRKNAPLLQYRPVKMDISHQRELELLKARIHEDYTDPEISTNRLMEKTGIPASRIFKLLKKEYGMSFKQLINKIRLTEAKRLLLEHDSKITEIAYNVGFNDLSYFNKLFKESEGLSPREYRNSKVSKK